ncbi:MAG: hypothetical protein KF690_08295 [Bacteroidetes bacterium]|nr:hypothetical protein [Bacteroidota bacterium]
MRRWIEFVWLTVLVALMVYLAVYYKILPLRSKIAVGIGIFVASMLYSYRAALRKRQAQQEREKTDR